MLAMMSAAEAWTWGEPHYRSDHMPVVMAWPAEQGEMLEFKRRQLRPQRWAPTVASAERIERHWGENAKGGKTTE